MQVILSNRTRIAASAIAALSIALSLCAAIEAGVPQQSAQQQSSPPQSDASQPKSADSSSKTPQPTFESRGKKLVLKDGTYQIVRSYEKKGDVVRYYSLQQSQWEEIPAALVDWDATEKSAAADKGRERTIEERAAKRDAQLNAGEVLDVDASLEVAPGVILPQDEGLYVVQGSRVALIGQAQTTLKTDKKQFAKKVLTPIPMIVSERHDLEIAGKSSTLRLDANGPDPEFYLRVPYDSDEEPHILIVHAQVSGNSRIVDVIQTNAAGENTSVHNEVSIQRWIVAKGVYRYTLGAPLTPGEYAVEEPVSSGVMMFVWDFGVDKGAAPAVASKPH